MEEVTKEIVSRETIFDEKGHIKKITLGMAEKMLEAGIRWADEMTGYPCSVAVVDASGAVIAVHRGDGAPPGTVDIAIEKAWSAVCMGMPTLMIARMTDAKATMAVPLGMHGMGLMGRHKGRLCGIHGGIPIRETGTSMGINIIGGIGTSGTPSAEDDNSVSQAGFSALYD